MNFFEWLITQRDRKDRVGLFAQYVIKHKPFPKHVGIRLGTLLKIVPADQRMTAKLAHRQYRQAMRVQKEVVA